MMKEPISVFYSKTTGYSIMDVAMSPINRRVLYFIFNLNESDTKGLIVAYWVDDNYIKNIDIFKQNNSIEDFNTASIFTKIQATIDEFFKFSEEKLMEVLERIQ